MPPEEVTTPLTDEQRDAASVALAQEHRAKFSDEPAPEPEAPAPVVHDRPEHVPEKFFDTATGVVNYEAWNKAHTELESKFHQGSSDDADGGDTDTPADDKPAADGSSNDDATVTEVLETPAAKDAAAEYAENRVITDKTYAALEKQGISRDMVDMYVAGQESKASVLSTAAFTPAGGEERYTAMIEWAAKNLDEPSKKAFNTQVSSGDPDVISNAVTALAAEYGKTETVEGERTGGTPSVGNSSTFASRHEMTTAINALDENGKRKYDVDPAYRLEVTRKIGNSRNAGTINF